MQAIIRRMKLYMPRDVFRCQKCFQIVYSGKWLKQSGTGNASLGSSNFHVCFGSYQSHYEGSFGKQRVIKNEAVTVLQCECSAQC